MNQNKIFFFLVVFSCFSCKEKQLKTMNHYTVNSKIIPARFIDTMNYYGCFDLNEGYNELRIQYITSKSSDYLNFRNAYTKCYSYKSNDSVCLNFMVDYGRLNYTICNNNYQLNIEYSGDNRGYYDDKNHFSFCFVPPIAFSMLILNKDSYKIGDTICGYVYVKTGNYTVYNAKEYKEYNFSKTDIYYGYFKSIITTKEVYDTIPPFGFL